MLRQIRLKNYRCFSDHTVPFEKATVVVGKNNAGKSTLVEALELVSAVVNRKGATFVYPPGWLDLPKFRLGIAPSISHLGLNLSTIFHRYANPPAEITASFEGGATVTVYLGPEQTIFATVEAKSNWVTSSVGGAYIPHFGMCAARRMQATARFRRRDGLLFRAIRARSKENLAMATGSGLGSAAADHQSALDFFTLYFVLLRAQ